MGQRKTTNHYRLTNHGFIYKITNLITGQAYIGLTLRTVKERWASHRSSANQLAAPASLAEGIFKHGHSNFKIVTLGRFPAHELPSIERSYIAKHKTLTPHGYNRHAGGQMSDGYGNQTIVGRKKFKSLSAAARYYGIEPGIAKQRIVAGWTLKQALGIEEKLDAFRPKVIRVENKRFVSIQAAAKAHGLKPGTVVNRLSMGWSIKQALGLALPPKREPHNGTTVKVGKKTFSSIRKAAKYYGVDSERLRERISYGWSIEEALGLVPHSPKHFREIVIDGNIFKNLSLASEHFGIRYNTVQHRLRTGWTMAQALGVEPPPKIKRKNQREVIVGDTKFDSITEAALHFEVKKQLVIKRLGMGWSIEESLNLSPRKNPNSKVVTAFGVTYKSLKEALKALPTSYPSVMELVNEGHPLNEAVELAVQKRSIEYKGVRYQTQSHLARAFKIRPSTVFRRLSDGWSIAEAVEEIKRARKPHSNAKPVKINGLKFKSISEASRYYGLNPDTVLARIEDGWSVKRALTTPKQTTSHSAIKVRVKGKLFESIAAAATHFGVPKDVAHKRIAKGWSITRACTFPKRKKRRTQTDISKS